MRARVQFDGGGIQAGFSDVHPDVLPQSGSDLIQKPSFRPPGKPVEHRRPRSKPFGQIAPGNPGSSAEKNRFQEQPSVPRPGTLGKMSTNLFPGGIAQHIAVVRSHGVGLMRWSPHPTRNQPVRNLVMLRVGHRRDGLDADDRRVRSAASRKARAGTRGVFQRLARDPIIMMAMPTKHAATPSQSLAVCRTLSTATQPDHDNADVYAAVSRVDAAGSSGMQREEANRTRLAPAGTSNHAERPCLSR